MVEKDTRFDWFDRLAEEHSELLKKLIRLKNVNIKILNENPILVEQYKTMITLENILAQRIQDQFKE